MAAQRAVMPPYDSGNQIRGGRWGSSGMNRVLSNEIRATGIGGATKMRASSAGVTAETT